jgi:beta-mannosidase
VHTNSDATGDTHLWHVWHGLKPFNYFRQRYTRFCSEFGLESLPTLPTIASFVQPADYSLKSSVFLHHQRSLGGNDKMLYYLTTRFRIPAQFSDMVYLTQIMQAECMRIATEHWRRNRPRCSGALYWQLNDCWPVSSWASIDYYGRWKALQYAARRFNAPIAISIEEKGTQVTLHVANDTQQEVAATLQYDLQTFDGKILWWGEKAVSVPANLSTSLALPNLDKEIRDSGKGSVALVAKLQIANKQVATQVMLFALEKYIKLPDPDLKVSCRLENDSIVFTVTAKKLARFVEFELTGTDVIFSDNFFDLPANTTREIRCPLPNGWTLERVEKSVRVHSLAEVRPAGNLFSDRLEHYRSGLTPISISTRFIFSLLE